MGEKSLHALMEFLDWTADKGIMAKNTVGGRKAAVSKVLGVLDPEEQTDVTTIDLDSAMVRFINLEGRNYNTSSLNVYKSRTNAAINDFKSWLADPLAFKPHANRADSGGGKSKPQKRKPSAKPDTGSPQRSQPSSPAPTSANVFPIQIREDLVVRIHGLPFNLTEAEAERIANVVKAMATTE